MSDAAIGSPAWRLDPTTYLTSRPVTHQVPAKPQSRYLTMPDGVRIAIDIYVPNGPQPHDGFPTIL
ncbi:MAG: CocE/NonD family hydrolase, partial [Hyphomicrobiaceae bacterium]